VRFRAAFPQISLSRRNGRVKPAWPAHSSMNGVSGVRGANRKLRLPDGKRLS